MLILLDIDGVMVPEKSWKRPEFLNDGFPEFSNKATNALQKIISETNAEIMLTTSHKSSYTIFEWEQIFKLRNIKVKSIDVLPKNINNFDRKTEVLNWINLNDDKLDFIIIDDDKSLNELPPTIKDKLVQTSSLVGLTEDLANIALEIIRKQGFVLSRKSA